MLDFVNDYSEGAHEKILQRLLETNMEKLSGYGTDQYCESAKQKIREVCECPEQIQDISAHMKQAQLKHPPIKCWQFRIRTGRLLQKL